MSTSYHYRIAIVLLGLLFEALLPTGLSAQRNWRDIRGGVHGTTTAMAVTADGTIVHGSESMGIYQSNDGGVSWWRGRIGNGPLDPAMTLPIKSIVTSLDGEEILAAMGTTIFRSTDGGGNWTAHVTGIAHPVRDVTISSIIRLDDNRILAGTGYSFYRSTNDLQGFERIVPESDTARVTSQFLRHGSYIYAGTKLGVYRFRSDGTLDAGGLRQGMHARATIYVLAIANDGALLAGTNQGFYRSTDNGATWSGQQFPTSNVMGILVQPSGVMILATTTGPHRSTDNGATWGFNNGGMSHHLITSLVRTPDGTIIAGTGTGVHRSTNDGQSWEVAYAGLAPSNPTSILAIDSTRVFVLQDGGQYSPPVRRSTDGGRSWTALEASISGPDLYHLVPGHDFSIVAATNLGARRSTDNGDTWQRLGLDTRVHRIAVGADGHYLTSSDTALYHTTNHGIGWPIVYSGKKFDELAISPEGDLYAGNDQGLLRSQDSGRNWEMMATTGTRIDALTIDPAGVIYAGTELGVSRSADRGATWTMLENGPRNASISRLIVNQLGHIYAALKDGSSPGIFRSTDDGTTWERVEHEYGDVVVLDMDIDPQGYLYAIVVADGIHHLTRTERALVPGIRRPLSPEDSSTIDITDPALAWDPVAEATGYHLQVSSTSIFGQGDRGNAGASPQRAPLIVDDSALTAATLHVTGLTAGTTYYWRVRSRIGDGWDLWSPIFSFTVDGTISAVPGTRAESRPAASIDLPVPHPATGRSSVRFTIASAGERVIALHDLHGREIAKLAGGHYAIGTHVVEFETSTVAPGVYLLRLTGDGSQASRVMLVR